MSLDNLLIVLFSFLPALIYAAIIYLTTPKGSINLKLALAYLMAGMLSVAGVLSTLWLFPHWRNPISDDPIIVTFFTAFIQIALLEEGCKFLAFKITNASQEYKAKTPLIAIMFYTCMVSVGFAIIENVIYAEQYGGGVLLIRTFSAVLTHMICGLFLGYFIALGRLTSHNDGSEFHNLMQKFSMFRRGVYTFLGICAAVLLHGIYDLNLTVPSDNRSLFTWVILLGSLYLTKRMSKSIVGKVTED